MAPKRPAAAAASGSASDSEADAARHHHPRSASPSPSRSRSRSKTPPPNLHPNAAALSSTPASAAADFAAASDSNPGADFAAASDSNAGADGRLPSPRRSRERSPRIHSDSENSAAAAASDDDGGDEGNASPPPRSRRSSRVEAANIKPISSRPMDGPRSPAAGSSASQRRSKRPRSSSAVHSPEQQRRPPRVWSPEDEITILRALISYRAKKGVLPASTQDTGKLHSQIRGQLNVKASTTQLSDKVRRLRQKYNMLVTRTKNGRDPDLPTVHDRDVYELSKKVWGSKGGGAGSGGGGGGRVYENAEVAESGELQESGESDEDMEGAWDDPDVNRNRRLKAIALTNGNGNAIAIGGRTGHGNSGGKGDVEKGKDMYPYLWEAVEELSKEHPSGTAFRKAFGVLEGSRARAMEEKLQKFRLSEIRQQLRRMDLMKETVKTVLDALEGTD